MYTEPSGREYLMKRMTGSSMILALICGQILSVNTGVPVSSLR